MATSRTLEELVWGSEGPPAEGAQGQTWRNPHPRGSLGLSKATAALTSCGQQSFSKQDTGLEASRRSFQPTFLREHGISPV